MVHTIVVYSQILYIRKCHVFAEFEVSESSVNFSLQSLIACITLTAFLDDRVEFDEALVLDLSSSDPAVEAPTDTLQVIILDQSEGKLVKPHVY